VIADQKKKLQRACKKEPLLLSAHSGEGVQDALRALLTLISKFREVRETERETAWQP